VIHLSSKETRALGPIATYILVWMIGEHLEGRQQHQEKEIAIGANVSRNKVSDTMAVLESFGYVSRVNRYGWVLSEGMRQLPLYKMLAADYPEEDERIEAKAGVLDLPAGPAPSGNRTTCDSNPPSTTTVNQDINQPEIKPLVLDADAHKKRVEDACDECGIGEPARSEFARDRSITPEMIRYHCEDAEKRGFATGWAVWRLRRHWQVPKSKVKNVCAQTLPIEFPEVSAAVIPDEVRQAWEAAIEAAAPLVGKAVYLTYLKSAELVEWSEGTFTIRTGNAFSADVIRTRCGAAIEAALGARLEVVV
jgi:hypothetical protein